MSNNEEISEARAAVGRGVILLESGLIKLGIHPIHWHPHRAHETEAIESEERPTALLHLL